MELKKKVRTLPGRAGVTTRNVGVQMASLYSLFSLLALRLKIILFLRKVVTSHGLKNKVMVFVSIMAPDQMEIIYSHRKCLIYRILCSEIH
jgi:hypothetical protein